MENNGFVIENGVLKKYTGDNGEVIVPEYVVAIGEGAFAANKSITSVTMMDGLQRIEAGAFEGCSNLVYLTFPSTLLMIGDRAFAGCASLLGAVLPDSIASIGEMAFADCGSAFGRQLVLPGDLVSLGDYAFANCTIVQIVLNNRMDYYKRFAFTHCHSLEKLILPDGREFSANDLGSYRDYTASLNETLRQMHSPVGTDGCYIATAVYGSYDCPEVWTLRRFRDEVLGKSMGGRMFIKAYYALSPILAKGLGKGMAQKACRMALDPFVAYLQSQGISSNQYKGR